MSFFDFLFQSPIYFLWMYLAVISIVTFIVFGVDKLRAKKARRRISEATLLLLCAVGGSLGGLAGMYAFRHKTRHKKFVLGVPLILLAQVGIGILIAVLV